MSTPQIERLTQHCERLRLQRVGAELSTLLEQAAKREFGYADFLDEVLGLEVRSKHEKHLAMRVSMARFPFQKTLESFVSCRYERGSMLAASASIRSTAVRSLGPAPQLTAAMYRKQTGFLMGRDEGW